jgi:hypothetical protein
VLVRREVAPFSDSEQRLLVGRRTVTLGRLVRLRGPLERSGSCLDGSCFGGLFSHAFGWPASDQKHESGEAFRDLFGLFIETSS